ncbi:ComF family protein [Thermodesulfobacteriota bacterium]
MFIHPDDHPAKIANTAHHLFSLPSNDMFADRMTQYLCSTCRRNFIPVESPVCSGCGVMFKSRTGSDHYCGECITSPKKFKSAKSFGLYDHALMTVIHCLKYKTKVELAHPLGMLLFSVFIRFWHQGKIDYIVPVPLYPKKQRERGFNQSFLLIKDWQKWADLLPVSISVCTENNLLKRNRRTKPQTALKRKERLTNIKGAFTVSDTLKVKNKNILVVDDVYTTGATVNECATVLLRAGANYVDVLTLARAM